MATSGQTISQLSRDQIINAALRKIGVVGEGTTANAEQLSTGQEALNTTCLLMATFGMPLWKRLQLAIPMTTNVNTYRIGVGETINTPFPLKLSEAIMQVSNSNSQIDMEIKARFDWNLLPINSFGTPVSVTYQPFINYGELKVWPTPDSSLPAGSQVVITYQEPLDLFTSALETPDFPQEWQQPLIYQLALTLADEYGLPIQDKQWLEKQTEKYIGQVLGFGTEDSSMYFTPNRGDR